MTDIDSRIVGDRAYVTLDRPGKHNGLTIGMLTELRRAADELRRNSAVRSVILSGNGPSFCSGLDIAGTAANPLAIVRNFVPSPLRGTNTFQEACWAWRRLPQPVLAVVHGHCYGAGLQLAAAADFRFSAPDADFAVMEAGHGLVPDMSGTVTLSRLVGVDRALLLTLTADPVDAAYADKIGLVTEVATDPMAAAEELADRIARRSPHAVAAAKRMFDRTWHTGPRRAFGIERATQLPLLVRRALGKS